MTNFEDCGMPSNINCYLPLWYRNACKVQIVKSEGRRQLGKLIHNSDDNIKTDVKETGWENMDSIHVAQDRDQWQAFRNTVMNIFHKIMGIYCVPKKFLAAHEGLRFMEKVS